MEPKRKTNLGPRSTGAESMGRRSLAKDPRAASIEGDARSGGGAFYLHDLSAVGSMGYAATAAFRTWCGTSACNNVSGSPAVNTPDQ